MRELLIEKFDEPTKIDSYGNMVWRNEFGEIHHEGDMPAVIYASGTKQ